MELVVRTTDYRFVRWIVSRIKIVTLSTINQKRLAPAKEYFNLNFPDVDPYVVLRLLVSNIDNVYIDGAYHITFNSRSQYPSTDIPVFLLGKIINYGCLGLKSYPILTDVLRTFATNIKEFHKEYLMERGLRHSVSRALR